MIPIRDWIGISLPMTRIVSIEIPQYITITQNNDNCMSNLIQDGIGLKRSIADNNASRVHAPI
jgi:hypothetical protein